jgi:hypothetical protein
MCALRRRGDVGVHRIVDPRGGRPPGRSGPTTNWFYSGILEKLGAKYQQQRWVEDGNVIRSALVSLCGVTARQSSLSWRHTGEHHICSRDDGERKARGDRLHPAHAAPRRGSVSRRPRRRSRRRPTASGRFASRQAGDPARTAPRPAPPAAPERRRRTRPPGGDTCCSAWAQRGIGDARGEARTHAPVARLHEITVCPVVTSHSDTRGRPVSPPASTWRCASPLGSPTRPRPGRCSWPATTTRSPRSAGIHYADIPRCGGPCERRQPARPGDRGAGQASAHRRANESDTSDRRQRLSVGVPATSDRRERPD